MQKACWQVFYLPCAELIALGLLKSKRNCCVVNLPLESHFVPHASGFWIAPAAWQQLVTSLAASTIAGDRRVLAARGLEQVVNICRSICCLGRLVA
jgi:hypothetical protein